MGQHRSPLLQRMHMPIGSRSFPSPKPFGQLEFCRQPVPKMQPKMLRRQDQSRGLGRKYKRQKASRDVPRPDRRSRRKL